MDREEQDKVRNRIGEIMSRLLSDKYDAKVKIKFVPKDEENEKDNKE